MPRSDLVSLIIRLAIGLVILALIGYLLFVRLRKPRVSIDPTPNPSDTPVVIVTESPAPTIIPTPSLPEVGDADTSTPSGNIADDAYGSGFYRAPKSNSQPYSVTYNRDNGTRTVIHYVYPETTYTTVTHYPAQTHTTGVTVTQHQTHTSTTSTTSSSSQASASAGSASASATASGGSASASASARSW